MLTEHLGIETAPVVLRVPSPGRTHADRARLVAAAWRGLERRGLGSGSDPAPALADHLAVLARPDREVDGRLWLGERPLRVLAAAAEDRAVLAVLSGPDITLTGADPDGLPRHALSVLPGAPPGPGRSATLRTADFEAVAGASTSEEFVAGLRGRGVRADDAAVLGEMIGPLVARGSFGAARRDRLGKRHRADRVVSFFETTQGRYLQTRVPNPDGVLWTTISPAGARTLLWHVTGLLDG